MEKEFAIVSRFWDKAVMPWREFYKFREKKAAKKGKCAWEEAGISISEAMERDYMRILVIKKIG